MRAVWAQDGLEIDVRQIDTIIIHCSATRPDLDIGVDEIRRWHTSPSPWDASKPWSDIGYHYVIRRGGQIEEGRPIEVAGAHARGHNETSIGICLVGGINGDGRPDSNFTAHQWESLDSLVEELGWNHAGAVSVVGHRDVDPGKACPCFDVQAWATL